MTILTRNRQLVALSVKSFLTPAYKELETLEKMDAWIVASRTVNMNVVGSVLVFNLSVSVMD